MEDIEISIPVFFSDLIVLATSNALRKPCSKTMVLMFFALAVIVSAI